MTLGWDVLWPARSLRARAGDLELRWVDDELLFDLAQIASTGIHPPDYQPFGQPWASGPPEEIARNLLRYQWAVRPKISPAEFTIELAVVVAGRPVGTQSFWGSSWPTLREAETGSWLALSEQGRGTGTRMRALVLHGLFEGLGAVSVRSGAYVDNDPSKAVSAKLGYDHDGIDRHARGEEAVVTERYRMDRSRWERLRDQHARLLGADVELSGWEAVRDQLEAVTDVPETRTDT